MHWLEHGNNHNIRVLEEIRLHKSLVAVDEAPRISLIREIKKAHAEIKEWLAFTGRDSLGLNGLGGGRVNRKSIMPYIVGDANVESSVALFKDAASFVDGVAEGIEVLNADTNENKAGHPDGEREGWGSDSDDVQRPIGEC